MNILRIPLFSLLGILIVGVLVSFYTIVFAILISVGLGALVFYGLKKLIEYIKE